MAKRPRLPLMGLVMIVKDEEATLPRCLDSILPLISTWTICDTGSKDGTREVIREKLAGIPGRLYDHQWRNFSHNFNLALARARGTARWLIRLDADMTVDIHKDFKTWLRQRGAKTKLDMMRVTVQDHGTSYRLPLIVRGDLKWRYVFPTHEYLDVTGRTGDFLYGLTVHHHADGSSRADKWERDLELLAPLVYKRDPRAVFYTAQTYRFLGDRAEAIKAYELRTELGGWEEERWYARYMLAFLLDDIDGLLEVWRVRPWRHEPLSAAARIVAALGAAERRDSLFLESLNGR